MSGNQLNSPNNNSKGEDKNFKTQKRRVYEALFKSPKTMKEVDKETGIMRENICWICKDLRDDDLLFPVTKRRCSITKSKYVIAWTTNPNLIPPSRQLNLF